MICVPLHGKHISLATCVSPSGKQISLVISVPLPGKHISLVIYVSRPGKHVSLVICVPLPWKHISLVICVPPPESHISLVIYVSQVWKHLSQVIPHMHFIEVNQCFWYKNGYFLCNISQENVSYDTLERKNALLGYKKKKLKKFKNWRFSKGVNPSLWSTNEYF